MISWVLVLIPFVALIGQLMLDLEGHKVHHLVVTKEGMTKAKSIPPIPLPLPHP